MSDISFTQVNWGSFVLDGGAMFGIIPRPLWARLIPPNDRNGIRLAARSLVVRGRERVVLVDCGFWEYFPPKLASNIYSVQQPDIAATLAAQTGFAPSDVTDIVATHLHFDHVGGFLEKRPVSGSRFQVSGFKSRFPNARFHVQKGQLEWAQRPSDKDRGSYVPELIAGISAAPGLVVHDGAWRLEPWLAVELAHGHTPAMQIVHAEGAGRTVIHTADMIPTSSHVPLPYIMGYDNEPLKTAAEKKQLYTHAPPDAVFFFEHDPEQPFWTLRETEKGFVRGEAVGL